MNEAARAIAAARIKAIAPAPGEIVVVWLDPSGCSEAVEALQAALPGHAIVILPQDLATLTIEDRRALIAKLEESAWV